MPQFLDFLAAKTVADMKKRSRPGRKKTRHIRFNASIGKRDWFILLGADDLTRHLSVSYQTAYKWIAAGEIPDPDKCRLLAILAGGWIPHPGWEHWRFSPDTSHIIAPNGFTFAPGELAWLSMLKAQWRDTQAENARLLVQIEELKAQLSERQHSPVPFRRYKA